MQRNGVTKLRCTGNIRITAAFALPELAPEEALMHSIPYLHILHGCSNIVAQELWRLTNNGQKFVSYDVESFVFSTVAPAVDLKISTQTRLAIQSTVQCWTNGSRGSSWTSKWI